MRREIRHVGVRSAVRIAAVLGGVSGVVGALAVLWEMLQGPVYRYHPLEFVVEPLIAIVGGAVLAAIGAAVFVFVYNVAAERIGGIEIRLAER